MRYLPHSQADRAAMLARIGVASVDELFAAIPQDKRLQRGLDLPDHMGEMAVSKALSAMAGRNVVAGSAAFFIGAGAYRHHVPATVDHLIQRSEFLTSYTPYQPEVAQGTLQVLFEFQTQVAALTGMDLANASMYDGASAAAEAVLMAHRLTRRGTALIAHGLHPHYREAVRNLSGFAGHDVEVLSDKPGSSGDIAGALDPDVACVVVQNPDVYGQVHDLTPLAEAAHQAGALLIAVFGEVFSLGAVKPPGAMGADIVVGEGQGIGNALNFGGPYLGLFACKQKFVRQMPGRICGQTVDASGKRGFVLTLSTREQHIRREKATSNICTNSGLCALAFSIHMALLGEAGLRAVAGHCHANAVTLADRLTRVPGVNLVTDRFFNEFTLELPKPGAEVIEALAARNVLGGVALSRLEPGRADLEHLIVVAATETNTPEDIAAFEAALREVV